MLINADLVSSLVADQFPKWGGLLVKPVAKSGWDNRTFKLGFDKLVRLPSAEQYAPAIAVEQTWLPQLAPKLPVAIPSILGLGKPSRSFPWQWSICDWIEGENPERRDASSTLAAQLAEFLIAFHEVPSANGPLPGERNFHRGGHLSHYNAQTRTAIKRLSDQSKRDAVTQLWEEALASDWRHDPVWVHGDFVAGNLLTHDGSLSGVIDFGQLAVGDPACDLTIAWTFFSTLERRSFRDATQLDQDTWARAKGWAIWKALILVTGIVSGPPHLVEDAQRVLSEVLEDHLS